MFTNDNALTCTNAFNIPFLSEKVVIAGHLGDKDIL